MIWDQMATVVPGFGWHWVLVYLRLQAAVIALPGLGERVLPVRVRVAVAMALCPLLAPLAGPVPAPDQPLLYLGAVGREIVVGFASGALLRVMAMALDIATTAIAATASLSQIIGVQNEMAPHPIGNLLHLGGIAILMALGLPLMLVRYLIDGMVIWPVGSWPDIALLLPEFLRVVVSSFSLAMVMAAPFSLGGFLFQALSGVINRVMPALPVVFIGAPLSILMALTALAILGPALIALWADALLSYMLPRP